MIKTNVFVLLGYCKCLGCIRSICMIETDYHSLVKATPMTNWYVSGNSISWRISLLCNHVIPEIIPPNISTIFITFFPRASNIVSSYPQIHKTAQVTVFYSNLSHRKTILYFYDLLLFSKPWFLAKMQISYSHLFDLTGFKLFWGPLILCFLKPWITWPKSIY